MNQLPIMVVTTDPTVARDLDRMLRQFDYSVISQTHCDDDAYTFAAHHQPSLVIIDLEFDDDALGGIGRFAAAQNIREKLGIPVVLLTSAALDSITELVLQAHPYGHLVKPCDPRLLRMTLSLALHQHQTEMQLQQREATLQAITDSVADAIITLDAEHRITFWNRAAADIFGYPAAETLGRNFCTLLALSPEQVTVGRSVDLPARHRDGHTLTLALTLSPIQIQSQWHAVGIVRDVTAQRRTEARMRQLTRAVEQSPAAIVITDAAGRIEYVNAHFEKITGYTAADAHGHTPRLLKSGLQPPEIYRQLWQTITRGDTWTGELHNRRKDGTCFWEKASISPLRDPDGIITHFLAVKEDITAQKQTALDLERREAYLTAVIENDRGLIWLKDLAGRYLLVNRAVARLGGVQHPAQIIGRTDHDLWPHAVAEHYRAADLRVTSAGHSLLLEEQIEIDGRLVWYETYKTPVFDAAGRIIGTAGSAVDVTARHQTQQALVHAKEEAERASQAKSAFLAAMSHELRTPLNVINGVTATLLEQSADPALRESLELCLHSGQGLLSIIEEILDFSALQAGKFHLDRAPFALLPLLTEVVRQAGGLPAARDLTVTLCADPSLPTCLVGDARRLRQVLLNLLSNAVKFTERGAIHLLVRAQPGAGLRFAVVDTGIGIDPAGQAVVFEPFTQADGSITRRFGGTGLGLTISRSFVRLMGGELRLRSRPGRGSVFYFTLPLTPAADSPPLSQLPDQPVFAGRRLLLVTPVGATRRWLGGLAHHWGLTVTAPPPSHLTRAALAALPLPDLALIETASAPPGSALRDWLQAPARAALPVLWLTSRGAPAPVLAQAARLLPAPVEPAALAHEFAALLGQKPSASPAPLPGQSLAQRLPLRILAADDVKTNRQVLAMILKHLGYSCLLVTNGSEVLEALAQQPYDLILLDVQMPVMDGLTAAREICRLYPDHEHRPRLVALTANVLPGAREACLDAGMDDYLSKPLVPAALSACLEKLFLHTSAPSPSLVTTPPSAPVALPWIDPAHLSAITQGLASDQITATLRELCTSAQHDVAQVLPQVDAACAAQQGAALDPLVHGLKGCFQMLGWARAAHDCATTLAELRAGSFTRWATYPAELRTLHDASRREFDHYLAGLAAPALDYSCL